MKWLAFALVFCTFSAMAEVFYHQVVNKDDCTAKLINPDAGGEVYEPILKPNAMSSYLIHWNTKVPGERFLSVEPYIAPSGRQAVVILLSWIDENNFKKGKMSYFENKKGEVEEHANMVRTSKNVPGVINGNRFSMKYNFKGIDMEIKCTFSGQANRDKPEDEEEWQFWR